jgi:3-polyprenyl-4-hydroxybenzoate decarboxylase
VPPVPSFYHRPSAIEELVDDTVGRLLDLLGLEHGGRRWQGLP